MIKYSLRILIVAALLVTGCSRKKNTALSRAYHNTTSRYNGYFNARELMKESESKVRATHIDDYTQVLPIFIYPSPEQSQSMYPDMDKIIEKCSEVIERHSIYKRKKEYIKWIDDSYYLIGKARLYKEENSLAEETFLYVYQSYKKDPERYRGLNWLIKTFIETEQWDKAEDFLDIAEDNIKKYPEEYKGHFYAIYADFYMKRDTDYDKVIEHLETAVKFTKEKGEKRRYTYILAQIYQKKGQLALASERYSEVLKLNPNYIMRFNAKISKAIAYDVKTNDSKDIKKELNKMLRDSKNEEFRDQIYFALAEIALKEQDEALAIEYLRKSAQVSVNNDRQKALSYLRLADIFFKRPNYIEAQAHYDSTLQFLPEVHPEYYPTEEKNSNLQELVKNLKVIRLQDSLLALSQLSRRDREKKVKRMIKDLKNEEERRKQAELNKLQALQELQNEQAASQSRNRGQWYFYNQSTMAVGLSDFKQKWGQRPLEDNWRRKSKRSGVTTQKQEVEQAGETKEDSITQEEKYNPEFYLQDIPENRDQQLLAHGKIVEALFNVGTIFKESFTDYISAINSFERIITEYDTSKFNLPSHYQLYRIYKINEYDEKAEIEKKWVLDNHPFSEYAYLIKNPNYNKETKATKEKVEEFYAATYKLYKYGLYNDVIKSCKKADESFSKNHIKAKFDLLKAKAIGHSKSRGEFQRALELVVKEHPSSKEKKTAQELLDYMKRQGGNNTTPTKVTYDVNTKSKHIFIISAVQKKNSKYQLLKNKLSDFNKQYFRESKLSVTQSVLQNKTMYLVRTFSNQQLAVRYLKALQNNKELSALIKESNAKEYLISNENFRKLFQSKNESDYLQFYNTQYPI